MIAVDGVLFRHEIKNKTTRPLTSKENRVTHPRISPLGNYISYVRNGNLFLLPSENEPEYELTHDRDENISNGIPEFIAQEEMHRFDGYWWSPDDRLLAFTRVDSSKIPETYRHEINHSELTVIPQRYPYTGGPNAQVQLGIIEIESKKIIWLDWQIREDDYLTQVSWSPDSLLVIQAQSRDQKILSTRAFSYQSNIINTGTNEPTVGPSWSSNSAQKYFDMRKTTIYAGSTEIQKNILVIIISLFSILIKIFKWKKYWLLAALVS